MSSLIIGKNPIFIDEEIATVFGLTEAIIIQKIWYWMKIARESKDKEVRDTHFKDGRWWTYQSLDDWCKALPYISRRTIQRHLDKLEKLGVIVTGEYNKMRIDRTKWYSINDEMIINKVKAYGQNDHMASGQNDHTNNHKYTIPNNISKYRSNIDSCNNKDIYTPIIQSDGFSRQWWLMDDKKVVDIHNKGTLAAALDSLVDIPKRSKEHDYLYELITYFADTYKKKRRCKHPGIDYTKLIEYVDKLTEFSLKADQDIDNEDGTVYHKFSVYDYNLDDLLGMVDDYFAYKFDDCDYSFHHFMSDSVLKARFWQTENKYTKIAL